MTIQSAISALSPNLYWTLGEGAGNTAHNSGSLSNDGTGSGALDWTVRGPEPGTTAVRFATGGQIVGGQMDIGAIRNMTIMFWYSAAGDGTTSVIRPILSIGDVANRMNRGPVVYETHSAINTPVLTARWNQATAATGVAATYAMNWHLFTVVFDQTANLLRCYQDSTPLTTLNMNGNVAAQLTDPLLLRMDASITLAHVAVWTGSLIGSTQISTIAAQAQGYGYAPPISTIGGGDGGGGLTPDQATQLSEIDTKTDDIPGMVSALTFISDTVNTTQGLVNEIHSWTNEILADTQLLRNIFVDFTGAQLPYVPGSVEEIWNSIRRTFQTAGGLGLNTPIGSAIAHPEQHLLSLRSPEFELSGRGELTTPTFGALSKPYGIWWNTTTIPPEAGYRDGQEVEFIGRLVQFCPMYPELAGGQLYIPEVADFRFKSFYWLWQEFGPQIVLYDVTPGFVLTCRWVYLQ